MIAVTVSVAAVAAESTKPSKGQLALDALKAGGAVGSLVFTEIKYSPQVSEAQINKFVRLAQRIEHDVALGRAGASVMSSSLQGISTALWYTAAVDPEPLTKTAAALAAWGAQKAGEALGEAMIERTRDDALAMLSRGLQHSGLSFEQLRTMSDEEIRTKVSELKIGEKRLDEVFAGEEKGLAMIKAHAIDVTRNIAIDAIRRAEANTTGIDKLKASISKNTQDIDRLRKELTTRVDTVEAQMEAVKRSTQLAHEKLGVLAKAVGDNKEAIHALASISYSNWSTEQKLMAVRNGFLPQLSGEQKNALIGSLEVQLKREREVRELQDLAGHFGSLTQIASNLGVSEDVVKGLSAAQIGATAVARFLGGDELGGVAGVASLLGIGRPDAAAVRHREMMNFMKQQFAEVHTKLNRVIELQVQTLQALALLREEQRTFRIAVLDRLDRIERVLLNNNFILQALQVEKWWPCLSFYAAKPINGSRTAFRREHKENRRLLLAFLESDVAADKNVSACYQTMADFLRGVVKTVKWDGSIIDSHSHPSSKAGRNMEEKKALDTLQAARAQAYLAAKRFLHAKLEYANSAPAEPMARLLQPVSSANAAHALAETFCDRDDSDGVSACRSDAKAKLAEFTCGNKELISPSARGLLCYTRTEVSDDPPSHDRWKTLTSAALIGPQAEEIIDIGLVLATVSSFADSSFKFVSSGAVKDYENLGPTRQLKNAFSQNRAGKLVEYLGFLATAKVLQQSMTYGSYTAELVVDTLYDENSRILRTQNLDRVQMLAYQAMSLNPVLARNVVMLSLRRALQDSVGGREAADDKLYMKTRYHLGLLELADPGTCRKDPKNKERLGQLFPGWNFQYVVTESQARDDPKWKDDGCPRPVPSPNMLAEAPIGSLIELGPVDALGTIRIPAPAPHVFAEGLFEVPASLAIAVQHLDSVNQAQAAYRIVDNIRAEAADSDTITPELLAEGLLDAAVNNKAIANTAAPSLY